MAIQHHIWTSVLFSIKVVSRIIKLCPQQKIPLKVDPRPVP